MDRDLVLKILSSSNNSVHRTNNISETQNSKIHKTNSYLALIDELLEIDFEQSINYFNSMNYNLQNQNRTKSKKVSTKQQYRAPDTQELIEKESNTYSFNELKQWSLKELKNLCKQKNLAVSGKKQILINRILNYESDIENQQQNNYENRNFSINGYEITNKTDSNRNQELQDHRDCVDYSKITSNLEQDDVSTKQTAEHEFRMIPIQNKGIGNNSQNNDQDNIVDSSSLVDYNNEVQNYNNIHFLSQNERKESNECISQSKFFRILSKHPMQGKRKRKRNEKYFGDY